MTESQSPPPLETEPIPDAGVLRPRRRPRKLWIALGALGAAAIAVMAMTQGTRTGSGNIDLGGRSAAPFTVSNVQQGQPAVSLQALRGKPVVINFWASWCLPCRREMPAFQAAHEALGGKVAFVGIDNKDFQKDALDLVRTTGIRYPSGFDPDGSVASRYGLVGLPTTVFVSADGRLLERRVGEVSAEELRATISRLYGVS